MMLRSLIFLFVACHLRAAEVHWPGWLGPQRDGQVRYAELPDPLPAELKPGWARKVGTGYGSPLVSGGRVYLHAREGEEEVLWCLDLADGSVHWRKAWKVPFKMGGGGERHSKGPKSSPLFAGGRVFTRSIDGRLSAWDAESGRARWQSDGGFPGKHPYWGASSSPVADADLVFAHFGGEAGALAALDAATGKTVWRQGKDGASYASPLLVEIDGGPQVVEWNRRALVGVEAATGAKLWEHAFPEGATDQNMPTPTVFEGLILLGGENRGLHGILPLREGDAWRAVKVWSQKKVALNMASGVMNEKLFYGFSHYGRGRLFCLDPADGDILWQGPARAGQNATFLSVGKQLLVLLDHGLLKVVEASGKSYREAASWRVSEQPCWAPPVLLSDGILVKDWDTLQRWSF